MNPRLVAEGNVYDRHEDIGIERLQLILDGDADEIFDVIDNEGKASSVGFWAA